MSEMQEKGGASERAPTLISRIWLWLQSILYIFIFVSILFLPAGRLDWIAGWTLLGFFMLAVGFIVIWLRRYDPDLLEERQTASQAKNVESWDRVILGSYTILLLFMLILAALDAGRFRWSHVPMVMRAFGWFGLGVAFVIVWRVMAENTFLSERVRIQAEREHQVITTGPYQYVRHPMYFGVILAVLSVPFALGSWWALAPALLIVILFILRTALEDRTLMLKLNGYKKYAEQVPYKLVPWIW